jgi:hypothetical protein
MAFLIAGLAAPAPRLFAHGNDYLFARVSPGDGGAITVELTADYGGGTLITSEEQARQVLADALQVRLGQRLARLDELGELRFERRSRQSDDAPVPPSADPGPHLLLTAVWRARLPGQTVVFATPQRTPHDVLLWNTAEPRPEAGQSRWMLLICGEESRPIALAAAAAPAASSWIGGLAIALLVPAIGWQVLRRRGAGTPAAA